MIRFESAFAKPAAIRGRCGIPVPSNQVIKLDKQNRNVAPEQLSNSLLDDGASPAHAAAKTAEGPQERKLARASRRAD